jgi:hypothetical protein
MYTIHGSTQYCVLIFYKLKDDLFSSVAAHSHNKYITASSHQ